MLINSIPTIPAALGIEFKGRESWIKWRPDLVRFKEKIEFSSRRTDLNLIFFCFLFFSGPHLSLGEVVCN